MKKLITTSFLAIVFAITGYNQSGLNCSNAIPITPLITCNFQSFTTSGTEMWFQFIATSTYVNISLESEFFGVDSPHIHYMALIGGTCGSQIIIAEDELPFVDNARRLAIDLNASNLIVGNAYYIKIDREGPSQICDKTGCTGGGSGAPANFMLCLENLDIFIPPDVTNELPIISHVYEQNRGQLIDMDGNFIPDIKLSCRKTYPEVYIANTFTSFVWSKVDSDSAIIDSMHRVDMKLTGADINARVFKTEEIGGHTNYYSDHIPNGVLKNKSYSRAVCYEVYPKIDMHLYSNESGIKIYFVIKPGGDANVIKLKFNGALSSFVNASDGLTVNSTLGDLIFEKAHVYRVNPGNNIVPMPVSGNFIQIGPNEYQVHVQNYPPNMPVIIQIDKGHAQQLLTGTSTWSTFFGGNKDEIAYDITSDPLGNIYVTGETGSNLDFPTPGAFQGTFGGGTLDAFVAKFNDNYSNSSVNTWATYYGGTGAQHGYGIAHDETNNKVYICGKTDGGATGLYQPFGTGYAHNIGGSAEGGFIARFDNVLGFRDWGTKFGSSGSSLNKIKCDDSGNIYVVGVQSSNGDLTCSPTGLVSFPACNPGGGVYFESFHNGGNILLDDLPYDGSISKFNSGTQLVWSTLFGGEGADFFDNLAIDDVNNKLYVVGRTRSTGASYMPIVNTLGPLTYFQQNLNGTNSGNEFDGIFICFTLNGNLELSTFWGGNGNEGITGVDIRTSGAGGPSDVFISGYTSTNTYGANCVVPLGGGFPHCSSGGYDQNYGGGTYDAFIAKFIGSNVLLDWSTFVGGDLAEGPEAKPELVLGLALNLPPVGSKIHVMASGNVLLYGNTRSKSIPGSLVGIPVLNNPAYYNDAQHEDNTGSSTNNTDVFINLFNENENLLWGTYFGGTGTLTPSTPKYGDRAGGITSWGSRVYICGNTYSTSNFPLDCPGTTMPYCQGYTTVSSSYSDAFVAQLNLDPTVGLEEVNTTSTGLQAYPNPTQNYINLKFLHDADENMSIEMIDILGKGVFISNFSVSSGSNTYTIDMENLSAGLYFVRLKGKSTMYQVKIVRE